MLRFASDSCKPKTWSPCEISPWNPDSIKQSYHAFKNANDGMSASWHFIKKISIGNLVRSRLGSATIISLEESLHPVPWRFFTRETRTVLLTFSSSQFVISCSKFLWARCRVAIVVCARKDGGYEIELDGSWQLNCSCLHSSQHSDS